MEQLAPLLGNLAIQLGTTMEHLWGVLVCRAWVAVVSNMLCMGMFLAVGLIIYKAGKRITRRMENDSGYWANQYDWKGANVAVTVIGLVVVVAAIIPFAFALYAAFIAAYNPEIYALDKLLSVIK
jgi:hypothetical protein